MKDFAFLIKKSRPTYLPTDLSRRVLLPNPLLLIMFCILILFTGCEKEESINSSEVEKVATSEKFKVVDGVLHFLDQENYLKDAELIQNLPEPEFREWERRIGFKSLRTWISDANDALEDVRTEVEHELWLEKYEDIIKIEESEVKAVIEHPFAQVFANRNGEFMIGEIYSKTYEDKIVYIRDGDRNKLEYAKTLEKSDLENDIVIDNFSYLNLTKRNDCSTYQDIYRAHGKYRVNYIMGYLIGIDPNTNDRYTSVWIFLKGQRRNWLGIYKDYDADLKWMECAWKVIDNWGRPFTRAEHVKESSGGRVKSIYEIHHLYDYTPASQFTSHYFEYNKGKGTSNFLDWDKYAVHCCGFPTGDCPAANG